MNARLHIIAWLLSGLAVSGCGAPTKSAGDVSSLFAGSSVSLQSKESSLCDSLGSRDAAPTTKDMHIDLGGCADSGKAALDYKKISSFYFTGLDNPDSKSENGVIHISARSQVWLNKSLLGLASSLGGLMKKKGAGDNTGLLNLPDSADGKQISGLVTPKIEMLEEPKMDLKTLQFSTKIHLTLDGIVKADHIIDIDGKLIDNMIAVTVQTTEDADLKTSILKNFQAVIMIIPHAGDCYLDLFVDLNVNDIGASKLIKDQVSSFLATGMKGVIDSLMQLKG